MAEAAMVPDRDWRIDVLARRFFDLDAVYASRSAQERTRVVAFEAQYTPQSRGGGGQQRPPVAAEEGSERAWVLAAGLDGLHIRRDRAVATSRLMKRLREVS